MGDLSKISKKHLNNMAAHASSLETYYRLNNQPEKAVRTETMGDMIKAEFRKRAPGPKFKVSYPNSSVVMEDEFDKRMLATSGLTMKVGKKNTSFIGSKKDIKNYFYNYGSEVSPNEIKRVKSKNVK